MILYVALFVACCLFKVVVDPYGLRRPLGK